MRSSDDHAHEQNNKIVKGIGGATGIFDSPIALAKWMIAGPEIAWILENLEDFFNDEVKGNDETKHQENTASFKKMFRKDFEALKKEFSRVGNRFEDDSEQMYTIVSRNIMDESSSQSVYSARCLGQEKYHQYTTDVLVLGKKSIYDTIERNKVTEVPQSCCVKDWTKSHITEIRLSFVFELIYSLSKQ